MYSNKPKCITIANNIRVNVPESLRFMTTFVLHEQNDWFEDEIKFVRHFARPGMKAVDIGANYGLYTLSLAKIIGNTGRVWAFEPTAFTSTCLNKSLLDNKLNNVKLIQAGLSNRLGKAKLFTSPNSELNSLSSEATSDDRYELISLLTLDHCKQKYGWDHIDFIKLDAEGEECNILKKGKKMLSSLSPLIMYELKHGENINLPLVTRFINMGYNNYRLVPGLNTLIPFDHNKAFDGYLLNLFCCKSDKSKQLESNGFLVRDWDKGDINDAPLAEKYIADSGFGKSIKQYITLTNRTGSDEYLAILNLYIMAISGSGSRSENVGYLMSSLSKLRIMLEKGEHHIERLVTFSRIAFDAGERALGVKILSDLVNRYAERLDFEVNELFLPASRRYESITPDSRVNAWLFSSILEQLIKKRGFSCYFTRDKSLPLFEQLNKLGFSGADMQKRYQLVKACYSSKARTNPSTSA